MTRGSIGKKIFAITGTLAFLISAFYVVCVNSTGAIYWPGRLPAPGENASPGAILSSRGVDASGHMEVALAADLAAITGPYPGHDWYDVYVQTHISANSLLKLGYSVSYGSELLYSVVPSTEISFTLSDDSWRKVDFPRYGVADQLFTFSYFGKHYTSVWVHENGFLCFGNEPAGLFKEPPTTFPFTDSSNANAIMAPLWRDYNGGGLVICGITNTDYPYEYSIQFWSFENALAGRPQSFGVTLKGDGAFDMGGEFRFIYQDVKNPDGYGRPKPRWIPTVTGYQDHLQKWGQVIDPSYTDTTSDYRSVIMTPLEDNHYYLHDVTLTAEDSIGQNGPDDPDARVMIMGEQADRDMRGTNILGEDIYFTSGTNPWIEAAWTAGFAILGLVATGGMAIIITALGLVIDAIFMYGNYHPTVLDPIIAQNVYDSAYDDTGPAWACVHGNDESMIGTKGGLDIYSPHDMYLAPLVHWIIKKDAGEDPRTGYHTLILKAHLRGWDYNGGEISADALVDFEFNPWRSPDPPQNLAATPDVSSIELDWQPPANAWGGVEHYSVYKKVGAGAYTLAAELPGTQLNYVDTAVSQDVTYTYQVYAGNLAGWSAPSNAVSTKLKPPPLTLFSDTFDDGSISDWTILKSGTGIVALTTTRYQSPYYSLNIYYTTTNLGRATSPTINLWNPGEAYTLVLYYRIESTSGNKEVVVVDDGRVKVVDRLGTLYAITPSGEDAISAIAYDMWHRIELKANPVIGTYEVFIDNIAKGAYSLRSNPTTKTISMGGEASPGRRLSGTAWWDTITLVGYAIELSPTASFTATPSGLVVSVDGSASSDPDGTISSYAWSWGDGTSTAPTTSKTASHTYSSSGTYTIVLTVTDNGGNTGTASKSVTLTNQPPVASFSMTVTGWTVSVDASASYDPDGVISTYAWSWGDGTTSPASSTKTASHHYNAPGTYTVLLTVRDNAGQPATKSQIATIGPDTTGPTTLITLNGDHYRNDYLPPVVVVISAEDTGSGVASIWYRIGNQGSFLRYTTPLSIQNLGSYTIQAYSVDVLGNVGRTVSKSFNIVPAIPV